MKRILHTSYWFAGLFAVLFLFRLLYGYYGATAYAGGNEGGDNFFSNLTNLRKNYASEKLSNAIAAASNQPADIFNTSFSGSRLRWNGRSNILRYRL